MKLLTTTTDDAGPSVSYKLTLEPSAPVSLKQRNKKLSYNGAHLLSEPFPFDQSVESRVFLYRKQRLTRIVRESSSDIQCKVRKSNPFTKQCQLNLSNMHNI